MNTLHPGVNLLLKPLELAYRAVAGARRRLHRAGVLKPRQLPRPVISVGNLSFGGSGKTPLVIAIAGELVRRGFRVVVLSRGYGRGDDPRGDEPTLIAGSVPQAAVVVGADRYAAGSTYLRDHDGDVFLLDDGFQHLQLHRDFDIVIDDPHARWHREGAAALRDADLVIFRGVSPPAGGFALAIEPTAVVKNGQPLPLESIRGLKVLAFAGLADNQQFFDTCRALGAELVATRSLPDHHRYSESEIEKLRSEARRLDAMLLTTEKDFVKLRDEGIAFVRVEARITPREEFFSRVTSIIGRAR